MATEEKNDAGNQKEDDLDFEVEVVGDDPGEQQAGDSNDDGQDGEVAGERRARTGGDARDSEQGDDKNISPEEKDKREKRRKERQLRKQRRDEARAELEELRTRVAELESGQTHVAGSIRNSEFQRVSAALNAATGQMQEAHRLLQEAKQAENWGAHADALEAYWEARGRAERLNALKTQFEQQGREDGEGRQRKPDPVIQRRATSWRTRNSWYDPSRGDADSKIAAAIDEQLVQEGLNPKTDAYWAELDRRIAKQLPHRANRDNAEELDDDLDETPSPTSGSGRERAANGKRIVHISRARIDALREAGVDVSDPKEMAPYIKRFQAWDKKNAHLLKGQ